MDPTNAVTTLSKPISDLIGDLFKTRDARRAAVYSLVARLDNPVVRYNMVPTLTSVVLGVYIIIKQIKDTEEATHI